MTSALRNPGRWKAADYLAFEEAASERHEFVDGILYAMVGGSDRHGIITLNLASALSRGLPDLCQVFGESMRLRIETARSVDFYYPDVLVSCDQSDRAPLWRERPILIAEVVSPSSDRIDRNEKLTAYAGIASVMEYLIIAQEAPIVEIRRRKTGWEPELVRMVGELDLESVGLRIPVAELYRRIDITRGD